MAERLGEAVLELNTSDKRFNQGVDRAEGRANKLDRTFKKTSGRASEVGSALGRMGGRAAVAGSALGALGAGGLGLLGLGASLSRARTAVEELDRVGKAARSGGLDPETYQEFAHAADLAGLSTRQFDAGLRIFSKNANDAILGTGQMKTALERLNPELLESIKNAKTQEERIRLMADAVKNSTSEIEKAALAQAAFGGKGTTFINFLDQGADGFSRMAAEARSMGIVIENDVVRNAEEMNDKLSIASRIIDAQLNQAFIDLAPILVDVTQLVAGLVRETVRLIDNFRAIENRSSAALDEQLSTLGSERIKIETQILELKDKQRNVTGVLAQAERKQFDGRINSLKQEMDEIAKQEAKVLTILEKRRAAAMKPVTSSSGDDGAPALTVHETGGRDKSAREADRQADALTNVVDALRFEAQQLGLNSVEQRINLELKRAGVTASSEAGIKIAELVHRIEEERLAIEASNQATETHKQKLDELRGFQDRVSQGAFEVGAAFGRSSEEGRKALIRLGLQLLELMTQTQQLGKTAGGGNGFLGSVLGMFGGGGGGGFFSGLGSLLGFANGGSFTVGGVGGTDKNLVAFKASRGERVDVSTPGQQRAGGGNIHITLRGDEGGLFMPRVKEISGDVANATVRDASPQIIGEAVGRAERNVMPSIARYQSETAGGDYRT